MKNRNLIKAQNYLLNKHRLFQFSKFSLRIPYYLKFVLQLHNVTLQRFHLQVELAGANKSVSLKENILASPLFSFRIWEQMKRNTSHNHTFIHFISGEDRDTSSWKNPLMRIVVFVKFQRNWKGFLPWISMGSRYFGTFGSRMHTARHMSYVRRIVSRHICRRILWCVS